MDPSLSFFCENNDLHFIIFREKTLEPKKLILGWRLEMQIFFFEKKQRHIY
jgi:hypothetical protein